MRPASDLLGAGTVLCLGAHPDDIEIGCGGTLRRLLEANDAVDVHYVVFSGNDRRAEEARSSAAALLAGARCAEVEVLSFREGYFPWVGAEVKDRFEAIARAVRPHVVFTHARADLHQDHRVLSELTWQTFRDHLVLEYEIPKYDGDLGVPNAFVPLDAATCDGKVEHLLRHFPSQHDKPWFTDETFRATLRLRGVECRSATGYAEAFVARKLVLA